MHFSLRKRPIAAVLAAACALACASVSTAIASPGTGGIPPGAAWTGEENDGREGGSSGGSGSNAEQPDPGRSWKRQIATWYGPGFWGNRTACGQRLTRRTVGVAHRTLPCGSRVLIRYAGETLRTRVIDRGPYANHAKWDLTRAAAALLGFDGVAKIRVAKLGPRSAR